MRYVWIQTHTYFEMLFSTATFRTKCSLVRPMHWRWPLHTQDAIDGAPGNFYMSAVWAILQTIIRSSEGERERRSGTRNLFSPHPDWKKMRYIPAMHGAHCSLFSFFLSFNTETTSDEPCFRYTRTISGSIFLLKSSIARHHHQQQQQRQQ